MSKRPDILQDVEPELREAALVAFRVRAFHPGCGGELVSTGRGISAGKTSYIHRCQECGADAWLDAPSYPRIVYREAGTD